MVLTGAMLDGCIGTGIDASAAFDAFCDFFCDSFAVDKFENFNGACGDAFT